MGTLINIRVVQPHYGSCFFRNGCQLFRQRRINLLQFLVLRFFQPNAQHFHGHRIELRYLTVQRHNDNAHRRCLNQQIKKMVLLAHTQTLVLKLLHHTVEDVHDTVGLILSHLTEPTAEILFAQQLHTTSYRVHRLDNLTVEHHQIDKYKRNDALHNI